MCLNATVFVATHGGNMADFLIGERVYNGGGLSLSPHKTFLMELFGYLGVQGRTHLKELRAQVRRHPQHHPKRWRLLSVVSRRPEGAHSS